VAPPSTAKNVISVGASENDRGTNNYPCDTRFDPDGQNTILTYGEAWPDTFTTEPLKSDPIAGNAEQMAGFSSRGPCVDGRIKPDVVAPGSWILSGYSGLYQQGYDSSQNPQNNAWQYDGWGFPLNYDYKYMGGTSMACPLTAGAAAVVRDFYHKEHQHNASAALVKASLINSAVDLADENNDGINDNFYPIPNSYEGWGRVDLVRATDKNHVQFEDEATGLPTGGNVSKTYNVAGGAAFQVTLAWADHAQPNYTEWELINDLDLVVTSPGGTTYRGNVFSGGWSAPGGTADRRNNVECVYVQSAQAGDWTVRVEAYNVPQGKNGGKQPFALVVRSEGQTPPPPPPPSTMHVGDLEGSTSLVYIRKSLKGWRASVSVKVHDQNEIPVSGAVVTGTWSGGYSGSSVATTGSDGMCTFSTGTISTKKTSVTFTANNVSKTSYTYVPGANHDTDGDSNGTSITITRP
jgi:hypothetical protein